MYFPPLGGSYWSDFADKLPHRIVYLSLYSDSLFQQILLGSANSRGNSGQQEETKFQSTDLSSYTCVGLNDLVYGVAVYLLKVVIVVRIVSCLDEI